MSIEDKIVNDFVKNDISFVTTVPCKQLAGVIGKIEECEDIYHIPSNKEDEGMGLCAGAYMGGKKPAIIMQNTAIGVTINTLVTLTQYYRLPLPMLISYRGELGEPVACQVEMAVHTKALLNQLKEVPISCKDVTFKIFGLSLATFNIFISLIISVIVIKLFLNYEKNK